MENKLFEYLSPWIQTTNRCNLRCDYCYVPKRNLDMGQEVYDKINRQLIDSIRKGRAGFIKLRLAGGEPLMVFEKWRQPIHNFLDEVNDSGGVEILTNLARIPQGFEEFALDHKNFGLSVSLDSLTYSKPYGSGKSSAKDVLRNIEEFKKHKPIFIMSVLTSNGSHLPDLAEYVTSNGFKWVVQMNKFPEKDINQDLVRRNLDRVVDVYSKKSLPIRTNFLFNFCDFGTANSCEAGQKLFYIDFNGDIYNCQMQVNGKPLTNIGDGNLLQKLKENRMARPYEPLCTDCLVSEYCRGDCPVFNSPSRRDYFCEIMKGYFQSAARNILAFRKD